MTKGQLDNLISFCFNLHKTMDVYLIDQSPDYIMEKWDKYIGVKPIHKTTLEYEMIMCNKHFYKPDLVGWLERWDKTGKNYKNMKEILQFILVVNTKSFNTRFDGYCTPSELIDTFNEYVGDVEMINKDPYKHLHDLVYKQRDKWLKNKEINRDYKLNILV